MIVKLSDAQLEIVRNSGHQWQINNNHLTLDDSDRDHFLLWLAAEVAHVHTLPYEANSRRIFATRYLERKVLQILEGKAPEPAKSKRTRVVQPVQAGELQVGDTVRLIDDTTQTFTVVKMNADQSVQVYGGDSSHKSYRDFHLHRLARP